MRVIVTGGAGFIGSHIVDALVAAGHTVWVCDDLSSGKMDNINPSARFEQCDIADPIQFLSFCGELHFDAICHQAAQSSLLRSVEEPDLDARVNILGTINVIQAARRAGARIVMASTSAVYADFPQLQPYQEDGMLNPTRPYGIAKMAAEYYVRASGLRYTILRYGNVYGPRQVPVGENQLVPRALDYIYKGAPFVVNGDGEQTRDFVYVKDISEANVKAIESGVTGIFNAGSGKQHSVNEVLVILKELTHFAGEFRHGPGKPNEPRRVLLDSTRAHRGLGWWATIELFYGLLWTTQWYREKNRIFHLCTCGHADQKHTPEETCTLCECSDYKWQQSVIMANERP